MLTPQELEPRVNGRGRQPAGIVSSVVREDVRVPPLLVVSESPRRVARQRMTRYGRRKNKIDDARAKNRTLTRKDLGLDEPTFRQLDLDENGALDEEELAQFLRRTPDVDLQVRLGRTKPGEAALAVARQPVALGKFFLQTASARLEMGATRLEWSLTELVQPRVERDEDVDELFAELDKDKNGFLEPKEVEKTTFSPSLFAAMDRDGDGRLSLAEVKHYFAWLNRHARQAKVSCASVGMADLGASLFDLLDTDRDGRLSQRELRQAPGLIDKLDRDGDDKIARDELPHTYRILIAQGDELVSLARDQKGPVGTAAPLWFQRMDLNHDGDLSRREFLGTDEQSHKLDADGDGLISVEEARRADREFRQHQ